MDSPAISVVIPAFNSAAFVRDAIASVRGQTVPVAEIIVVDDGSTDDTEQACRSCAANVHYVFQRNRGPAAARNRGIAESHGEFVAFLDADDLWVSDKIARQLRALAAHPDAALVAGDMAET